MDSKHIAIGALLLILAASGALAQCSQLFLEGDHYRQAEQYREIKVKLVAYSNCSTEGYTVSAFSDLPVKLTPNEFTLGTGSQAVYAAIAPGAAEPGLYTVHVMLESKQDIAREEFVVKIVETKAPLLTAEAPAVMGVQEEQEFDVAILVRNEGDTVLHNIVTFIDEAGEARVYADELETLQAGESKYVNFHYAARPRGEYALNYTVAAGEYKFVGQATVGVSNKNYPLTSIATVKGHDGGYLVSYLVKNSGPERLSELFLTIEDAPADWSIISPSKFSLAPGETKEVELVALYGAAQDAPLTLALYEGRVLRAEDALTLSQARLSGTGLLSFAQSFELGLIVLLVVVALYFAYHLRIKAAAKKIKIRSLVPEWIESLWPF